MLVVKEPSGELVLIRQPDHAAMCAQLARAWRRPAAVPPRLWQVLLQAVSHHDDGWLDTERRPLLDEARCPLDFKAMPTERHVAIWRRGVATAQSDNPFAALLVAMYARLLYTTIAPPDTDDAHCAQTLIDELTDTIDDCIRLLRAGDDDQRCAVEPPNLLVAQRLFAIFDSLPLALAGAIDWFDQTEPLAFGDRESTLQLARDGRTTVRVQPWPFEQDQVALTAAAFRSERTRFDSSADLAQYLTRTPPIELSWALTPA